MLFIKPKHCRGSALTTLSHWPTYCQTTTFIYYHLFALMHIRSKRSRNVPLSNSSEKWPLVTGRKLFKWGVCQLYIICLNFESCRSKWWHSEWACACVCVSSKASSERMLAALCWPGQLGIPNMSACQTHKHTQHCKSHLS